MVYEIDLSGKVAIITGAAKGIGASTAKILAEAGAQVVIDDVLPVGSVQDLMADVQSVGPAPKYVRADVSAMEGAQRLVQRTLDEFGQVDILVNNAGVVADWDTSWAVHVKAAFYCAEAVKEPMAARQDGRIVNISSTAAITGGTGIPQYVATKGGIYSLTRYLARTYAPLGVLVNGIAPAVVISDMLMTRYEDEQELLDHYVPIMPVKRIGYPVDIARIVLFLCSELSSFMTGEILIADGGRMHVG